MQLDINGQSYQIFTKSEAFILLILHYELDLAFSRFYAHQTQMPELDFIDHTCVSRYPETAVSQGMHPELRHT